MLLICCCNLVHHKTCLFCIFGKGLNFIPRGLKSTFDPPTIRNALRSEKHQLSLFLGSIDSPIAFCQPVLSSFTHRVGVLIVLLEVWDYDSGHWWYRLWWQPTPFPIPNTTIVMIMLEFRTANLLGCNCCCCITSCTTIPSQHTTESVLGVDPLLEW